MSSSEVKRLISEMHDLIDEGDVSVSVLVRKASRLAEASEDAEHRLLFDLHLDGVDLKGKTGSRVEKWPDAEKHPRWDITEAFAQDRVASNGQSLEEPLEQAELRLRKIRELMSRPDMHASAAESGKLTRMELDLSIILTRIKNRVSTFVRQVEREINDIQVAQSSEVGHPTEISQTNAFETHGVSQPEEVSTSSLQPSKETRALIMKGGGVKGLAYIGALKELEKHYHFNWFIGTSAGAITAVLLAVGYKTEELETILKKQDFREFLDASKLKAFFNLISGKGGLFEARTLRTWLDKLFHKKGLKGFEPLPLRRVPHRVTVYASRRYKPTLKFDSEEPEQRAKSASFAVRCSMSIPLVFIPPKEEDINVLDGGMRNNYPVEELLGGSPETAFIGLYLGNYYEGMPKSPSLLSDMLHIWTEAVDVVALSKYEKDTVIIDPRPISTLDFNLTAKEKDFLLKIGKASALRFLYERKLPDGPTESVVQGAEAQASQARVEVEFIRKRRKWRRRGTATLVLTILCAVGLVAYQYLGRRDIVYPEKNYNGISINSGVIPEGIPPSNNSKTIPVQNNEVSSNSRETQNTPPTVPSPSTKSILPSPKDPNTQSRNLSEINGHIGRCESLFAQTAYRAAISECNAALRLDPNNSKARRLKLNIERTIRILNSNN